ncbi:MULTISPECIES: YdgA family protein [unclassified Pseudomonas]|uniref:YdgA family protein n=1 Tax=unclassified Pseudomonas TaxID=196821 RepID=UPI0021C64CA1|nr:MULTISPECIES: YdgA family protein [unclassified Pseudomonas]MCU1733247.1 YdgA family protein [Pseudomonas sp. 20P_3.2_Bac4]MCU1745400.1 YdgA family protein [Pseudomonas sp. 20P_3.2_Bac5]
MKKILVALAGVVALSAAGCAWITWHTGKSMPTRMDALLEHANQQLQVALGHEGEAKIELLWSAFHTFSADARYRVTYESVGQDPVQLEFVDRIEYGPLPWSRVKRMQLMPVMATSNFTLVKTEGSATWFSASKGEVPLRGGISVNYEETINTHVEFAPFEITEQDYSLTSSGGSLLLNSAQGDDTVAISGEMERLRIHLKSENIRSVYVYLAGIDVNAHLGTGLQGLRTGWLKVGSTDVGFQSAGKTLSFGRAAFHDEYQVAEDGYSRKQIIVAPNIRLAGWPYGSARLAWRVEGLDPAALKGFLQGRRSGVWGTMNAVDVAETNGADTDPKGLLSESDDRLEAAMLKLLTNRPKFVIEELSFKTSEGESRADMSVQFRRPDDDRISFADLIEQMPESGNVNLEISKSTIDEWARPFNLGRLTADTLRGAFNSRTLWEILSSEAERSPFLEVVDDSILMKLQFSPPDDVDLNGKKMTREEFLRTIWIDMARRSLSALH